MAASVGIDIEDVARFKVLVRQRRFIERVYTPVEARYCASKKNKLQHFAARFAAKEAVWKALSETLTRRKIRLSHRDIGVANDDSGKPHLTLPKPIPQLGLAGFAVVVPHARDGRGGGDFSRMKPVRVTMKVAAGLIHRRPRDANKGSNGRVLVVAGSRGMVGAAVLSSSAAVRSGAGLVRLATVQSQQRVAVIRSPLEITTHALPEDKHGRLSAVAVSAVNQVIKDFNPTVLAVGPGLGVNAAVMRLVRFLLFGSSTPLVLDADGLNALSKLPSTKRFAAPVVLTPHAGELARLMNISVEAVLRNRLPVAKRAAKKFGCVCVLKGPGTLITDGTRVFENTTGNPAMASGGMGDVLTGLIASTWAQSGSVASSALSSSAFGVFLHGLCADIAVRSFPERTLLASDLMGSLPEAVAKIWRFV